MEDETVEVTEDIKEDNHAIDTYEKILRKRKFFIDKGGQSFVRFMGLLHIGHLKGIKQLKSEQVTNPDPNVAQFKVTLTMKDDTVFEAYGDAKKSEFGSKPIAEHWIRMAETRAICRALRWATNIGYTAWDELNENDKNEINKRNKSSNFSLPVDLGDDNNFTTFIREYKEEKLPMKKRMLMQKWEKEVPNFEELKNILEKIS